MAARGPVPVRKWEKILGNKHVLHQKLLPSGVKMAWGGGGSGNIESEKGFSDLQEERRGQLDRFFTQFYGE